MRLSEAPKPIRAYFALVELTLDSFKRVWHDWVPAAEAFSAMHPEAGRKLGSLMREVDQRRYEVTSAKSRSAAVFVANSEAIINELRDAVAMVELMDNFAQATSAYTKSWLATASTRLETLRDGLASLERSTAHLTLTHALMSEHTHAVVDEYVPKEPAHPDLVKLHSAFFSELFRTRDAYVANATLENLQCYIAEAQELAEKENPLQAYAHTSIGVKYDGGANARAAALLDKLIRDELMVELLHDREELSHAE